MKRLNWTLFLVAIVSLIPLSRTHAQLGKLKNKLGLKKSKAQGGGVELDFSSSPFMPAITMESLLSGGIKMSLDGKLSTPNLAVSFLPPTTKKGDKANYDSYKKEDLLLYADVVNTKSKAVAGRFHYSVNPVLKVGSVMNQKQVHETEDFTQIGKGQYRLDFYAAGKLFYTFPFEVMEKKVDDPYAAFTSCLFLKGPWEDWNYFDFSSYSNKELMVWHHFIDNTTTNVENKFRVEQNCDYKFKYELLKDGKIFGAYDSRMQGSKSGSFNLARDYNTGGSTRTKWINNSVQVTKIPGTNPDVWQQVKKSDFTDGQYEMIVYTVDCTGQELKRHFPFQVKNGKFIQHPEQDRKVHQDPLTIIEGGPNQFWYKRKQNHIPRCKQPKFYRESHRSFFQARQRQTSDD